MSLSSAWTQQRFFPVQHFYKDRIYQWQLNTGEDTIDLHSPSTFQYTGASFFPETEAQLFQLKELNTDTKQRKWVGRKIFQEHFFEIKGKEYYITIDPIIDFSMGRDLRDSEPINYFQNTRGIEIKGDILDNISFFTNLRENQQRFLDYQTDYIAAHGEYYLNPSVGYVQQNGSIPGAARTKPFKEGAFDFAYVTGAITYRPIKQIGLSLGNNMHFVGSGYRSLLLSDHAANAPYARISYTINPKLSGEVIYAQYLNLLRSELQTETERQYEKKGFSVHYFTYKPIKKLAISLFESTVWDRGDTSTIRRVHGLYYNPVPVVNTAVLGTSSNRTNSMLGLNVLATLPLHFHVYGQFAMDNFSKIDPAYQVGFRWSQPFSIRELYLQAEYNSVPKGFYGHPNSRLTHTHNNLPLAHPFGSGFSEIVGRISYEWKRIAITSKTNLYHTSVDPITQQFGDQLYVVPVSPSGVSENGKILIQQLDLLYRFNRMNNLQIFATVLYRTARFPSQTTDTFYIGFGVRTQLSNHYFDF